VGGIVTRYDRRGNELRDVEVWPVSTAGHPAKDVKYRFVWDFPFTISPHDHNRIYAGSQFVHMSTNGGQRWTLISPDLTLNDRSKQQRSGGLTGDNIGVEYGDVVYAIAESPMTPGLIWAGTNDGVVQLTRDGGASWTNVSKNIRGLVSWGTISNIEPSRFDAGTAYLTVNAHQEGNFDPWVYRTADYGHTWKLIVNGIPRSPVSYARCVREDPFRRGLLYLGTENALYVSFDDGERWQPLQLNLPHAPVSWLTVQGTFHDLVVSTYGRGFYVLDDVTPLEQLTAEVRDAPAHLFAPRPAYRFRQIANGVREMADDPSAGRNPPYGATLNYWLKAAPAGDVSLTIADSAGRIIRSIAGPKVEGVNRVMWDLRFDPATAGDATGAGATGGRGGRGATITVLAPPGRYTVKLRVGATESARPLVVRKDPDSGGSAREIAAQQAMLVTLSADLASSTATYAGIDGVRTQLRSLAGRLQGDAASADVHAAADSLARKFTLLADSLAQQNPGAFYEWPQKLTSKLSYLATEVQSSDRQPTDQARAAHAFLKGQLRLVKVQYDKLLRDDVAGFNDLLRRRGLAPIITVQP